MKKINPNNQLKHFKSKKSLVILPAILLIILSGFIFYQSLTSQSAIFGWIQTDWSGGNSENTATHETDQTGWSEFSNKEEGIKVSNTGEATLQNTTHQHTSNTDTDFEKWTLTNTEVSGDSIVLKQSDFTCGTSTIQDADGNSYETVQINDQCWMAENMRTTKYPDETSITKGPSSHGASGWDTDEGYYSCPPNSSNDGEDCSAADSLGMLYQWSAAMASSTTEGDQGICPDGWRVPTDAEQHALEDYLAADGNTCDSTRDGSWDCDPAGSKLAGNDAADEDWDSGTLTSHADFDSSGFNASPSGNRNANGRYYNRSSSAYLWSSSESGSNAWSRYLLDGHSTVYRNVGDFDKARGFSVRCLKDTNTTTNVHDIFDDGSAVATYQFDGDATDLGGSYDGTWSGTESYTTEQFDQAADFDGSTEIDTSLMPPTGTSPRSFSFWVKKGSGYSTMLHYGSNSGVSGTMWEIRTDYNSAYRPEVAISSGRIRGETDINDNAWHHVVVVFEGGSEFSTETLSIYVDNSADNLTVEGTASVDTNSSNNLSIASSLGHAGRLTGQIDQVRIFNRALTSEEVDQLYNESN